MFGSYLYNTRKWVLRQLAECENHLTFCGFISIFSLFSVENGIFSHFLYAMCQNCAVFSIFGDFIIVSYGYMTISFLHPSSKIILKTRQFCKLFHKLTPVFVEFFWSFFSFRVNFPYPLQSILFYRLRLDPSGLSPCFLRVFRQNIKIPVPPERHGEYVTYFAAAGSFTAQDRPRG